MSYICLQVSIPPVKMNAAQVYILREVSPIILLIGPMMILLEGFLQASGA